MHLPPEYCEKYGFHPVFINTILTYMTWIANAKNDFDIEHLEKYDEFGPCEAQRYWCEHFEEITEEENQKLNKEIEEYIKNCDEEGRMFYVIAKDIRYKQIKKEYVALIAKKEQITWKNFLAILRYENPALDILAFTKDCKNQLTENSDSLMKKLLDQYCK